MDEKRASTDVQADARRTNRAGPRDSPGKLLKAVTETISGPIRITGESVSDEQDAWAKAMLELIEANYSPQQIDLTHKGQPASPTTPSPDTSSKRPSIDATLAEALRRVGYSRIDKFAYRDLSATPEVEKILYLQADGRPRTMVSGSAGLRNPEAQAFARACVHTMTPHLHAITYIPPSWMCDVNFSLSMMGAFNGLRVIDTASISREELSQIIENAVTRHVKPAIGTITTQDSLLEFLVGDGPPMPWYRSASQCRAAQIAFLGRKFGHSEQQVRDWITPHLGCIQSAIDPRKTTVSAEALVDHAIEAARSQVRPTIRS